MDTRTQPPGSRVLEFTRDSFFNSTLIDRKTDEEVYSIESSGGMPVNGIRTVLFATDGGRRDEIAQVVKGAFFKSDRIVFRGGEAMKVKDWMKDSAFSVPEDTKLGSGATQYTWTRLPETLKDIALYTNNSTEPIAWYRPSVRAAPPWPASLVVGPEALAMQDIILASLLVVLQVARVRDSQADSYAAAAPFLMLGTAGTAVS